MYFFKYNIIFSLYSIIEAKLDFKTLNAESIKHLISTTETDRLSVNGDFLKHLLIPRVSGTKNNTLVRNFIIEKMKNIGWKVEVDSFRQDTLIGVKEFNNIIATFNPNAPRKIVLSAHFDSKNDPGFIGATDSAVPCAILLDLAYSLDEQIRLIDNQKTTLQFVFFDGEEAFKEWTDTDSIYGARHLAKVWNSDIRKNIDYFVLLDLLGSDDVELISLNESTKDKFNKMVEIEDFIRNSGLAKINRKVFFNTIREKSDPIEDDHKPFLNLGVKILHLIPPKFPKVWHKLSDNSTAISQADVEHLSVIFKQFVLSEISG